jgi:guanylate kinase
VLQHVCEADYLVVNDEFDNALADIRTILRAQGLTVAAQRINLAELLASLIRD